MSLFFFSALVYGTFAALYAMSMSNIPSIKLPAGMTLRETPTGYEVIASREPMTKTVAFRLSTSEYSRIMALVECFPDKSWGAAMRWLLEDDRVKTVMAERIAQASRYRNF